ncbi:hypothetical protein [Streptomyces gobiensis]|uniref:hypothetical protein n=1 Tax=Streptomyces gobiensis TaxID=2875706 RepID=UPI001E2DD2BE|nr:hypothetical protein [Streptomyces gobiensis]UGY90811.1 hypothetical protein test1122_03125 [Streptomyces gobiensis]
MSESDSGEAMRVRADRVAAALVTLGYAPQRAEDPAADFMVQHATLLAAAVEPYRESAADPASGYGGPPVLAQAVQNVHGWPAERHLPVHEHLITHIGLAIQYLHALFGPSPQGQEKSELLARTRKFIYELLATAGQTEHHMMTAHLGGSGEPGVPGSPGRGVVTYAVDPDVLDRMVVQAARTAAAMRDHLDEVAPRGGVSRE